MHRPDRNKRQWRCVIQEKPLAEMFINLSNEVASGLCSAARNNSESFIIVLPKKSKGRNCPVRGFIRFFPLSDQCRFDF